MDGEELAQGLENEQETEKKADSDIRKDLSEIKDEIGFLKDIFVRRLNEDKQKAQLINILDEGARFAFIEPFLTDIILILDRLEQSDDDFARSIYEELYDVLNRRGVERISVGSEFDPALYKAVRSKENPNVNSVTVTRIIRNGYILSGKVIRAAEVGVDVPVQK